MSVRLYVGNLPQSFDAKELDALFTSVGEGIRFKAVQDRETGAGRGFGFANVDDIEKLLPIAYQLVPEGYAMADRYALWGWKGGVEANADRAVSRIGFDDSGRGSGKVPQMPAPVSDEAP
mgnify:CR=1 FL=1